MAKRIIAMLLSLVLVLSLATSVRMADAAADPAWDASFSAHLQFLDKAGAVGNFHDGAVGAVYGELCTPDTEVSGPGTYTVSWNMSDYPAYNGYTANGVSLLYININGAYETFTENNYDIRNVKLTVDGTAMTVDPRYVWTYQSEVEGETDDFVIELYNVGGVSGYYGSSAIDPNSFTCSESISVSFDVVQGGQYNAHLQFMDGDWAKIDHSKTVTGTLQDGTPYTLYYDKDGTLLSPVGNFHDGNGLELCTSKNPLVVTGPGTYTVEWDMDAAIWGGAYADSVIKGATWLYVDIDDAFKDFTDAGYTVSDVKLFINGVENQNVDQNSVWTYSSAVAGETDDYVIELYNVNGYSGAWNQPAIDTALFDSTVRKIGVEFTINEGDGKNASDTSVHTGKWVTPSGTGYDNFNLTLEAWVTGESMDITQSTDMVLVLDQSASMYTPVGLPGYLWHYSSYLDSGLSGLERFTAITGGDTSDLGSQVRLDGILNLLADPTVDPETGLTNAEKFGQLGYLVAQDRVGDSKYCTKTEHTHSPATCSFCPRVEHTHTASCVGCTSEDRLVYMFGSHSGWNTSNLTGRHYQASYVCPGVYRITALYDGLENSTTHEDKSADGFGDLYEDHREIYITVVGADSSHPAYDHQVGDLITVNGINVDEKPYSSITNGSITIETADHVLSANTGHYPWVHGRYDENGTAVFDWYGGEDSKFNGNNDFRLVDGIKNHPDFNSTNYAVKAQGRSMIVDVTLPAATWTDTYTVYGTEGFWGVAGADSVTISVSTDGNSWTEVGWTDISITTGKGNADGTYRYVGAGNGDYTYNSTTGAYTSVGTGNGDYAAVYSSLYTMTVRTDTPYFARKIRFDITPKSGGYIWVDEVEVACSEKFDPSLNEVQAGAGEETIYIVDAYSPASGSAVPHHCDETCGSCPVTAHTHDLSCGFQCTLNHEHNGESCGLSCGRTAHTHTAACETFCGKEAHVHFAAGCYGPDYGCTKTEHVHSQSAGCYTNNGVINCYSQHTHTSDCGMACNLAAHTHNSGDTFNGNKLDFCWSYDVFVVQYNRGANGVVDSVWNADGTINTGCDDSLDMYRTLYTTSPHLDSNGMDEERKNLGDNREVITLQQLASGAYKDRFYFYKSQYGALYDAITTFVNDLEKSGANHRVSVIGFSAESYSRDYTNGSGIYINGEFLPFSPGMDSAVQHGRPWQIITVNYPLSRYDSGGDGIISSSDDLKRVAAAAQGKNIALYSSEASYIPTAAEIQAAQAALKALEGAYSAKYNEVTAAGQITPEQYGQALVELNPKNDTDNAGYHSVMNSLKSISTDFYYTNHYVGLYMATKVFEAYKDQTPPETDNELIENNLTRQKVVVLFTDGMTSSQLITDDNQMNYTYQEFINDKTVSLSRELEEEYGASVYSICTSTVSSDIGGVSYLYYASSDFAGDSKTVPTGGTGVASVADGAARFPLTNNTVLLGLLKNFMRVASAETLSNAFNRVFMDIGGTTSQLGINASMQDIICEDFELPAELVAALDALGVGAVSMASTNPAYKPIIDEHIKVYTVNAVQGTAETPYNFPSGTTGMNFNAGSAGVTLYNNDPHIRIEVGRRLDGRYYVRIDGFNYSDNFISTEGRDTDGDLADDFWGRKLVVVVPITTREDNLGGIRQDTNHDTDVIGGYSGIIAYNYDAETGKVSGIYEAADFADPHVDIPTRITVRKIVEDDAYAGAFDFAGSYMAFQSYGVSEETTTGNMLGGNYLTQTGVETGITKVLSNGGSFDLEGVLVGPEFTVYETDFDLYDVTVKVYERAKNPTAAGVITIDGVAYVDVTEDAGVTVDAANGKVTIGAISQNMLVEFTNTRKRTELTVRKTGANEMLDPNQTFIFTIDGTQGTATEGVQGLQVVVKGNGSVTVSGLLVGTYTVTEASGWSWRYEVAEGGVTAVKKADDSDGTVTSTGDPDGYTVALPVGGLTMTFDNERPQRHWMDGNSHCQNLFNGN